MLTIGLGNTTTLIVAVSPLQLPSINLELTVYSIVSFSPEIEFVKVPLTTVPVPFTAPELFVSTDQSNSTLLRLLANVIGISKNSLLHTA
ncbi:hypothetical protein QYS49_38050 [Marivirga salinae]|uniref:Uncharacterized protein n=1 Tax=Marivirga salinarum TaxID=3059078 RepID=A0AA51NAG7_9BACT|nr:hypothetical protein [Marivirga sp. BDSF4-3]WMN11345.1 hypothetical protein QYS49_38050 [Marivirga sp. BDSF4-3]